MSTSLSQECLINSYTTVHSLVDLLALGDPQETELTNILFWGVTLYRYFLVNLCLSSVFHPVYMGFCILVFMFLVGHPFFTGSVFLFILHWVSHLAELSYSQLLGYRPKISNLQ